MTKRIAAALTCCAVALLLVGCLVTPGKFTSSLDIRRDGHFTFAYKGEVFMLAFSKLGGKDKGANAAFEPSECQNDEGKTRKCTVEELAEQKKTWEDGRAERAEKARSDAENFKRMFGIDPDNPKAAEEMAARLQRQAGYKSVVSKGNGIFDVDFASSGSLDRDFVFPTIERMMLANSFVSVNVRNDRTVRVDAPGFSPNNNGGPFAGMAAMGLPDVGGAGKSDHDGKSGPPNVPVVDGTFTLITDGTILANNTDEGPQKDSRGQRLSWPVNPRTQAAPTALIRLGK